MQSAIVILLASCGSSKDQQKQGPPPATPVTAYVVKAGNATYFDQYPATVTPLTQVDVKPQVSGNILRIFFQDGQHVKKGQKLYEIDQQQYRGAYDQAVANLNVSKANLAKSQQDADRYTQLAQQDAIARQTLDHQLADLESSKRQVEAGEANVKSVAANLNYSQISAPMDGTIGISNVKVGTAVYQQTLLNTISADNPLAVDIAIDQSQIPLFTNYLQKPPAAKDSVFTMQLPDGTIYPVPGKVLLLDRAVDPTTGTIKARLLFANPKNLLKPGITTNVRVKHDAGEQSLLIPYKGVLEQLGEYFVFDIQNSRALQHKVVLGTKINDLVVVKSGVKAGDSIVIEGVQKLKDSAMVNTATHAAPPAQPNASGK